MWVCVGSMLMPHADVRKQFLFLIVVLTTGLSVLLKASQSIICWLLNIHLALSRI